MKIIYFLFIIFCQLSYSQKKFVDSKSNLPIVNLKFIDENGVFIGFTDDKGDFYKLNSKIIINNSSNYEVYNSDYLGINFTGSELLKDGVFKLAKSITIPEVIINMKKKNDYIVISGYYMSYQIIDKTPIAFSDGIIEYYIPKNNQKNVQTWLKSCRYYVNDSFINKYQKINGSKSYKLSPSVSPFYFDEEIITNEWNNMKVVEKEKKIIFRNKIIGNYSNFGNDLLINFIFNSPTNIEKTNVFGMTSETINHSLSEKFSNSSSILGKINIADLVSVSRYYNNVISNKKLNHSIENEIFEEFHTSSVHFISKQEYNTIKNNLTNKNRYDYKKPEKFVKSTIHPKIPNFIDNLLGKSLIDQK